MRGRLSHQFLEVRPLEHRQKLVVLNSFLSADCCCHFFGFLLLTTPPFSFVFIFFLSNMLPNLPKNYLHAFGELMAKFLWLNPVFICVSGFLISQLYQQDFMSSISLNLLFPLKILDRVHVWYRWYPMCCECLAACSRHRESFFLCYEAKQSD